ncbi:MAG: flagellar basal body-associated FliL family protein [Pirellulales bacterium]
MSDKSKPSAPPAGEEAAPRKSSPVMSIIKAVAFVSILVIVQVVGAAMFIPSGEETAELAKQYVAAKQGEADGESTHAADERNEHDSGEETAEVELGTFNITHFNPASNTTLSIDFELYGSVLAADEAELQHLLEKNKVRVREQVIMTLHAAGSKELSDSGLGLIKRQILEKTNRALGHPMLREVLFSKFNFVER